MMMHVGYASVQSVVWKWYLAQIIIANAALLCCCHTFLSVLYSGLLCVCAILCTIMPAEHKQQPLWSNG